MKLSTSIQSILFILIIVITGCKGSGSQESEPLRSYSIISEEPTETTGKAQIVYHAHYEDSVYTEEALEKILLDIYEQAKDRDLFKNFDSPTVIGAYLYASRETALNDESSWIAMLSKSPSNPDPRLSFNTLKLNGLNDLQSVEKSEDAIRYEELTQYLKERGLELCSFRKKLGKMEDECIRMADEKYPDYGEEHHKYSSQLMDERRKKLAAEHNLADSVFSEVVGLGMYYCK